MATLVQSRPPKELKGFKLAVEAGQTQAATLMLDRTSLAFWDAGRHCWVAEAGEFAGLIGSSSRDIRAEGKFYLTETVAFGGVS